jgi:hypothetical protein
MSNSFDLSIAACPSAKYAYSNRVYVSREVFAAISRTATALGIDTNAADPAINITVSRWVFLARCQIIKFIYYNVFSLLSNFFPPPPFPLQSFL